MTQSAPTSLRFDKLSNVIRHISEFSDIYDFCREIVLQTTQTLGFDRCGCFLYDAERDVKMGTWGIAPDGVLADERGMVAEVYDYERVSPGHCSSVTVFENVDLFHQEGKIGEGSLVQCAIFDGEKLLGWLFIDNFFSSKPFSDHDRQFLNLYCTILGQLVVRLEQHETLIKQNTALSEALYKLESAQEEIIESKKVAGLSDLVCGVAHELNTPLGVSMTAASNVQVTLERLSKQLASNSLTRKEFDASFETLQASISLNLTNNRRATELIQEFKKLVSTNNLEKIEQCDIAQLLKDRFRHSLAHAQNQQWTLSLLENSETQRWPLQVYSFSTVMDEIFQNAFKHAKPNGETGVVDVEYWQETRDEKSTLFIQITDTGIGLAEEHHERLFDPFFSLNRQKGRGLGASIAYNTVVNKLGGNMEASASASGGLKLLLTLPDTPPADQASFQKEAS